MKKFLYITFILLLSISLFGCTKGEENAKLESQLQSKTESEQINETSTNSIIYENLVYGFDFVLPASWKGYSIVTEKWEGVSLKPQDNGKIIETGPIIYIRNPKWTSKNPIQDIPIMVFTLSQWNSLQKGDFHIGAAPINPSELGRNTKYVFALPARYNFAFLPGYQEVENILNGNPLQPILK